MWCGARDGCTFEMIEGMAVFGATGGNPSGSRPNFFGRQHLTFDKGGKGDGAGRGDGCAFEKVVGMERSVGNPAPFGKGAKNVVLSVG